MSPPLDPNGIAVINQDRRRVSLRWLVGSVLTAFSGAALIGGAIIIALQGEIGQVERPQRALAVADTGVGVHSSARRADRLVRREVTGNLVRQEFKAPITVRSGTREVIKTRDFVRINAPLSLTAGQHAGTIAPFNPLNLFADGETASANAREAMADVADADVSIVKRELAGQFFFPEAPALDADEALAQVIAEERLMSDFSGRSALPQAGGRMMLFRSLRQGQQPTAALSYAGLADMPFGEIDVRVIPENVTLLPKLAPHTADAGLGDAGLGDSGSGNPASARELEEYLAGMPGEVILQVLTAEGASPTAAKAILAALGLGERDKLREDQTLVVLPAIGIPDPAEAGADRPAQERAGSERPILGRVTLRDGETTKAIAAVTDDGRYVPVLLPEDEEDSARSRRNDTRRSSDDGPGAPLYDSVHETVARYDAPRSLANEIVRLFAADTDFQRRVTQGESLELLYTGDEDGVPELLYAALTVEGDTKRLYRFQPSGEGPAGFYDTDGRSLQKFLIRKPIAEGRMTSGFGMRYHPVLSYAKMHTGVDWANKIGTPILAAGDGVVIKADWDSGYGRRTEIQHANGYVSTYSHQSRFARGIQAGARVRQGQVIGYLGNTGLSTGPHLHYEVMVNGRFVDPLKIKLPRSNELADDNLAEFSRQREQIKELLAKSQPGGLAAKL